MRITEQSESIIVIKNANWLGLVIGTIVSMAGLITLLHISIPLVDTSAPWQIGAICLLIGLSAVLLPTFDSIILDKTEQTLKMRQKNLIWDKNQKYNISDIKQLELWQKPNPRGRGLSNKLMCIFIDGNSVSLSGNKSSSLVVSGVSVSNNYIPEINIGDRIATFLNVPFIKDLRPLSAGEAISSIKDVFEEQIEKARKLN